MAGASDIDGAILKMQEPLLAAAADARRNAYAPYSQFAVGAAVLTLDGRIFSGCNMENASYGLTTCAERNAIAAAVAGGMLPSQLAALALVADAMAVPCGACLQVIAEFASEGCIVFTEDRDGTRKAYRLDELLPLRFSLSPVG